VISNAVKVTKIATGEEPEQFVAARGKRDCPHSAQMPLTLPIIRLRADCGSTSQSAKCAPGSPG
jgi:hypothetical protein